MRKTTKVETNIELIISCIKSESILDRCKGSSSVFVCLCGTLYQWSEQSSMWKKVKAISAVALPVSCANACGLIKWPESHDIITVLGKKAN